MAEPETALYHIPPSAGFLQKTAAASLPLPPHRKASACHVFYMPIPAGSKTGYFRACGRTQNSIIPHSAPGLVSCKKQPLHHLPSSHPAWECLQAPPCGWIWHNREKQERRAGCGKDCKVWAAQEEGEGGLCF